MIDKKMDLNLDFDQIKNHEDYHACWDRLAKIKVEMVEQHETCRHNLGDAFVFKHPCRMPPEMCPALRHVLELYVWRAILGFPSWNAENRRIFKLHCPDPNGTVWEMIKIE